MRSGYTPTEREPRTAIFLFLRASAGMKGERNGEKDRKRREREVEGEKG